MSKPRIMIIAFLFFPVLLLTADIPLLSARVTPAPAKPQEAAPSQAYPVTLGNETLFTIRPIKAYSGEERARTLSERLKAIAQDPRIPVNTITLSDHIEPLTLVTAGDKLLIAVFDEDAKAEGKTRQELAKERVEVLRTAVEKYRYNYSRKRIVAAALYTLIATLFLVALVLLLNRVYRKVGLMIRSWADSKKLSIHIQSVELIRAERIRAAFVGVTKTIRVLLMLIMIYAYLHLLLSFFPWTEEFAKGLLAYILVPLQAIGQAALGAIPKLVVIVIIALFTLYVLKLMRLLFQGVEKRAITFKGFYPDWAQPTYRICRLLVIAFAVVVAFPYIPGSDSPAFKGISIFLGVLFSLGSTSAIANILAGYSLIYRRVFQVGDRVKIADFVGDVVAMRLQVVHLRTIKNEEIVVPSSMIINSHVINYSSLAKERGLILHTAVTIGYDVPWRQVEALLLLATERTPGLLGEPAPFVLQTSLDDFYVSYELNVYTDQPQTMAAIYTDLHRNIQDAFNEYGVQIMSPSYRGDPAQPKIVPKDQWYKAPAKPPGENK